jgi:hypothetical protein
VGSNSPRMKVRFLSVARGLIAALVFVVAIGAGGAAFAQGVNGGGGNGGHAPPAAPPSAPGPHGALPPPLFGPDAGPATACDGGFALATPSTTGAVGDAVKALSKATQSYIRDCGCTSQACIADALDKYAAALAQAAPGLPPQLQNSADIVATAARRVRVARTKTEAVKALHDAIAAIHKDITLVRAEDPDNYQRQTRGGDFIVETLSVATLSLESGGGL